MKIAIWIGILIGGTLGGWVGALLSKGNWLSLESIILSGIGSLLGIWLAYKIIKTYF